MALVWSHGDKGGVGKSFVAKALIDYCMRHKKPCLPVDTDTRNADVHQVARQYMPVERLNLRSEDGWSSLVDTLVEHRHSKNIVISLPAGIGDADDNYAEVFKAAVDEVAIDIVMFWVINLEQESIKLLRHTLENGVYLPSSMVVVKNHCFSKLPNASGFGTGFDTWENSQTRQIFLENGGREIEFPNLRKEIALALDREQVLFSKMKDRGVLGLYDKIVLDRWIQNVDAAFAQLSLPLIP